MKNTLQPKPTADPTFRMSEPVLRIHKRKTYAVRMCEELVEGRWEGFVSMEPVKEPVTIQ